MGWGWGSGARSPDLRPRPCVRLAGLKNICFTHSHLLLSIIKQAHNMQNLLEQLRKRSAVSAFPLAADVPAELGPFQNAISDIDATAVQLACMGHTDLMKQSGKEAKKWASKYPDIPLQALAAEIIAIRLLYAASDRTVGNFHVQTNPFQAYSTERTIENARRLLYFCRKIGLDRSRVCIRIFCTLPGLHACEALENEGIMTSAVGVVAQEQVARAAEMGCTYVAPHVGDFLPVPEIQHRFDYGLCSYAWRYCIDHHYDTKIIPEGNIHTHGALALAGLEHIALRPSALKELLYNDWDAEQFSDFGTYAFLRWPGNSDKLDFEDDGDYMAKVSLVHGNLEARTHSVSFFGPPLLFKHC